MKLSRSSAYALTYLAHIARARLTRFVPAYEVAREEGLPERFLLKTLKPLVGAGVLRSASGTHGGYALARDPKDVTVLEVVEAIDGPLRGDHLPVGGGEGAALDRQLQDVCERVAALVRQRLAKVTLAELAKGR
jgi:Rrf2 family protein